MALSFFADIGTKKEIPSLTWTMQYEATCERLLKRAYHIGTIDNQLCGRSCGDSTQDLVPCLG